MKKKAPIKMVVLFAFVVFMIVTLSMLVVTTVAWILSHFLVANKPHPVLAIYIICITSIAISTVFARIGGKQILSSISMLNDATKEVAKGNFHVKISEDIRAVEIKEMTHNFNIMVEELSNTETFRADFISNVSHEFKTPIAAIEGYATLLQNKSISEEERDEYIKKILFNTKRVSKLTGNILQLSHLENQEILPIKKNYCLDEQLRNVILLYETQWSDKNINLDIDLDQVIYYGNEEFLAQVFSNIFGNAVKFTPANGDISVTLSQEESMVTIKISDSGIGMNDEVQKRVFEKFYQGDKSHSSEGNGLGLALAKRIVDLFQGTIELSSNEGNGTTFTIKLPK
ncbi:HAMP domain-containing sensor histidine kinase [Anaeromicropila herbilytica]|uniref:Heme sensor protein HssS n=1 Tax=Anaeromicropila herbilytica TaxID=2785025 RepID=A0A7R7EHS2_9FIRM|nr:HAMP domain-containing sensor histidine kinase [Anaeromicropila herbilytica]BCN28921.1 two component sensor kinase [Anaeromicropila herbilytica]